MPTHNNFILYLLVGLDLLVAILVSVKPTEAASLRGAQISVDENPFDTGKDLALSIDEPEFRRQNVCVY